MGVDVVYNGLSIRDHFHTSHRVMFMVFATAATYQAFRTAEKGCLSASSVHVDGKARKCGERGK